MSLAKTSLRGLTYYNPTKTYHGYTLFAPPGNYDTWLIDMEGRFVNHWKMPYMPGLHGVLLPSGNLLWQNAEGHPAKGDPQAYMFLTLLDDEGKPTAPPTAKKLGPDTRLKPLETREFAYEIPAEGVALVRAELYYNLLWPGLVEKFKHLPQELTAPMLIGSAEQSL